jgi:uncharacterized MAPEG superfamily protein
VPPKRTVRALAPLLEFVQFALIAIPTNLEVGIAKTMSPRDRASMGKPLAGQVSPRTGWLIRALQNHLEALMLFTIAVVAVTLSGASNGFIAACAWVYLGARILYVPAYALGWVPWRTLFFSIGLFATLLMVLAARSDGRASDGRGEPVRQRGDAARRGHRAWRRQDPALTSRCADALHP